MNSNVKTQCQIYLYNTIKHKYIDTVNKKIDRQLFCITSWLHTSHVSITYYGGNRIDH